MEPISTGLLVAGAASLIASLVSIVVKYFSTFFATKRVQEITITTSSGERFTIGADKNLSAERIQEIVDLVERQSKTPSPEDR